MINISISTGTLILLCFFVLSIIGGIIGFIFYKDKKNDQAEIDDLINDIVNAKPRDEGNINREEKENDLFSIEEIESDLLKTLSKEEVQVTKIEPENMEREKIDLESMLNRMQDELDKRDSNKIELFEKDQEENAIISYKELVKVNEEKKAETNLFEKDQEENAIISYQEIEPKNPLDELSKKEDLLTPVNKAIAKIESPRENKDKKFKNTEFISPIYGKMEEHLDYPKVHAFNKHDDLNFNSYFGEDVSRYYNETQNNTNIDINHFSDPIKRNDEFLRALKEFRSNLQ